MKDTDIKMEPFKVQLINAPRSEGIVDCSKSTCFPPLGPISIATYCKQQFPNASIEVLDGELMSVTEIIRRLKPGAFVGIETNMFNYSSALQIAQAAKECGCVIILGGVYASTLPELILKNRPDIVDYVVVGYGEKPLVKIIKGELNLHSKQPQIVYNLEPDFNELPLLSRSRFVDMNVYIENFRRLHPSWSRYTVTNIFTLQGCKQNCIFCSRQNPGTSRVWYRSPELVWKEIRWLNSTYGIDLVISFDDQITQNLVKLRSLLSAKPAGFPDVAWYVFSSAEDITSESIVLLKSLPVAHVFIGVETGDTVLARTIRKGKNFSPQLSQEAVKLLVNSGIRITPSFVIGLPGETEATLKRTLRLAQRIKIFTGNDGIAELHFELWEFKENGTSKLNPEDWLIKK